MSDDRRLGSMPVEIVGDQPCEDPYPLGIPVRVQEEYHRRIVEILAERERKRRLIIGRDVLTKSMTQSDFEGLKRRGIVLAKLEGGVRIDELRGHCAGCGVPKHSKHFMSCWVIRPALLLP